MKKSGVIVNFGGIEEPPAYEQCSFVVLPVPYDHTTSYQSGARDGPMAILQASAYVELYDHELNTNPIEHGIWTLPLQEIDVSGPEATIQSVQATVTPQVKNNKFVIALGGEHSISLGAISAYAEKYPNLTVLQFDAHTDFRNSYEGSPNSHACVMRRVSELGVPIIQVGIRSTAEEEIIALRENEVVTFFAENTPTPEQLVDSLKKFVKGPVYITFDLDALDPSIMPATGTPEPGGLLWYETLKLIRAVTDNFAVIGFDVVELSPIPGLVAPDFLAAKLTYKIAGYIGTSQQLPVTKSAED